MSDEQSPEEKIKALFFQALQPVAKALRQEFRPSDITVTVNGRRITIDLGRTPLKEHVGGLNFGLMDFGGMWRPNADAGTIEYIGNELLDEATVPQLQALMAGSAQLDTKIAQPLGAAALGRSR